MWYERIIDRKLLPDFVLRLIIRCGLSKYSGRISKLSESKIKIKRDNFVQESLLGPIALEPETANLQHYELPTDFFRLVLGKHMKYSGSIWNEYMGSIDSSEEFTLQTYIRRSGVEDGHEILDLGSGWGSLSLYLAKNYKNSQITAVTNSNTQRNFIEAECTERNIANLKVLKNDVNNLSFDHKFDRIFSIEMLEHTRNVKRLLDRVSNWMTDSSNFFIQVFAHRFYPQYFDHSENSWMARYFFSGGMMPYPELYKDIDSKLTPVKSWFKSGKHYHKTLESWLNRLDSNRDDINECLETQRLNEPSNVLINRFRFFLIICSELFKYNQGKDWIIVNHLLRKNRGYGDWR